MSNDFPSSSDPEVFAGVFRRAPLYLAVSSLATGKFIEVNDAFVKVTGYSRAEAVGKSAQELGLWVDPAERAAGLAELETRGFIAEKEVRLRMKKGEVRDFLISAEVTELRGEKCILNAAVDITRRKRAEAAHSETEKRYQTLFNATDEGFCVVEVLFSDGNAEDKAVDYRFLETNPQFEKQSGLKNAVGKTARDFVPELEEHWFETYGKVALTGESVRFEDGSAEMGRWFDVYAFRIGGNESREVGILFTDISERKRAENALTALNQDLETRIKVRTRQVRTLAAQLTLTEAQERARLAQVLHDDLQQQLYAVQFSLHDIRKALQETPQEKEEALASVAEAGTRLKDAIAIARTTTANLSPPVLRGEGLVEALTWLGNDMRSRYDLAVTVNAPGLLSVPAEPVRVLLFNLVRELLFNVVKHAQTDAATVAFSEQEERLEITVSDLGRGFDPASLDEVQGSGLGLSGVRKRLELFGGRLQVTSTKGEGTSVTITLPTAALTLN